MAVGRLPASVVRLFSDCYLYPCVSSPLTLNCFRYMYMDVNNLSADAVRVYTKCGFLSAAHPPMNVDYGYEIPFCWRCMAVS